MLRCFDYSFDGYIFDCDGTLAESMGMHYRAWKHALKKFGAKFDFTWELFRSMAGMGLHHTVDLVNERFGENLIAEPLLEEQEAFCEEHIHEMKANPEVFAFAEWITEQGLARSIASGGHRHIVHRTLKIIGADHLFPIVVTQNDVTHSKPHPEMFLLAAEKMGVKPERCLVLEDSLLGIEAAKAAGMGSVLVRLD
ncbi:MAG: HAD-IA family hydrolase [Opitutales bacterium]|tara:strand:- start:2080 stop:2667 length:588 start_codon:yes stop_codon:yes gene_type:complete